MNPNNAYAITTAIDYVNAPPHLGHAYEKIAADVMARFQRMLGKEVFFLTGVDEHGVKVEKTARARGVTPRQHTDEMAEAFQHAWRYLNLTYDRFIRTTEADHHAVVHHLWRAMAAKGDIYKKTYRGLYCSGCEKFVTARDLDERGECPHHQRTPDVVEEENYFFRLTRYADAIRRHLRACWRIKPGETTGIPSFPLSAGEENAFVQPDFRALEVLQLLEDVEDISVSRHRDAVIWGIPVPDDPEQVVYVWIDALSNYLTGLGYARDEHMFQRFWPTVQHVIGKDILRFHAIYWPAMLLSAGVASPDDIDGKSGGMFPSLFAHGFININASKISKSLGNVISPFTLRDRFSLPHSDPIRYYLMTVTAFGQDGSFTEEDFKLKVNVDLANNLGNLLNRTLTMTQKYFDGCVPEAALPESVSRQAPAMEDIRRAYERFDFQRAAEGIFRLVDWANREINDREPWSLFKAGRMTELADLMVALLETLRRTALLLSPITPVLADAIRMQLGYAVPLDAPQWHDLTGTRIPPGQALHPQGPVLPRLESELAGTGKKRGIRQGAEKG